MTDLVDTLRAQAAASLFPVDGELRVGGLEEPVTVTRDRSGVPTIVAASLHDLWFAHGLVTAGERLFQLYLAIRASTGRLSEVFGERTVDTDRFARTIGFHLAGRRYLEDWNEEDRAMHARFRAGVQTWSDVLPAKPIEYTLLDLEPELPDDPADWAACFAFLAWSLSNNWDKELLRAAIRERAGAEAVHLLMPPTAGGNGLGSNAWAVAGSRTASGKPLLANDPHLLALQPGSWLPVHLRAPDFDVRGVALVFSPGVILGATPHHAWGVTNVSGDVQDLYEERDDAVLLTRDEPIAIRGEREPRTVTVRETRHGPIVDHEPLGLLHTTYRPLERTYALRWTGREHGIRPTIALEAVRATSFDEFRTAALRIGCPGQNFVYADVEGTIGYQCTGRHPIRGAGDGTEPVPGWTDEHEWTGWIAPDDLPRTQDPPEGYLVTDNDGRHASRSPHPISLDFHEPARAERITELLTAREDHDLASMAAIQADTMSLPARDVLPLLVALQPRTEAQRWALDTLAGWDAEMSADSRPAALFNAWCGRIARRVLEPRLGPELTQSYLAWRETFQCSVLGRLLRERPEGWLDDDLL
ncbi:MAG: penicillin acylase family protein, partial [Actinomycetota bacterium]